MAADPGLPQLRSLQMNFTGPVMGDPSFAARTLRKGRNVTSVAVDATVDGADVGNALCIFGAARESVLEVDDPAQDAPAPGECPDFAPASTPFLPQFFRNFEVKLAGGQRPMAGAEEGYVLAWARHADADSRGGMGSFICLGDVLPPAAFPMMRQPCPISSVNWMMNLLRSPETEEGWYLIESRQTAAREGYSSQRMRFWNVEGQLVAEGMQAVAVFG